MAVIDLKHCEFHLEDGYSGPGNAGGLINNGGGYTTGATTITVDGFTGAVANGDVFTIAGETGTPQHQVTAHSETLGNTTSITFTPALASSVADDAVITILPHDLNAKIGEGNLTYDEKRTFKYFHDRGRLDTVREEEEVPVDVKLDFNWEFLKSSGSEPVTIEEFFKQEGAAANFVTASTDKCEPYSVNIILINEPPCGDKETIRLNDFRWESLAHDAKAGTVAVTGKCNVTRATLTRG